MAKKFEADHADHTELEMPEMPRAPKRRADGDQAGNPEMTSLPDGDPRSMKPMLGGSKAAMVAEITRAMAEMHADDVAAIYETLLFDDEDGDYEEDINESYEDEGEDIDEGEDFQIELTSEDVDLSGHVAKLFEGAKVSDEFKEKAAVVFEQAVLEVANKFAPLRSAIIAEARNELIESLDGYLDTIVNEWVQANEIAIENTLRVEAANDFMAGLRNLFEEHYVSFPEEKEDIVEQLVYDHAELEEAYENLVAEHIDLRNEHIDLSKAAIVAEHCAGLTSAQANKLVDLAADMVFEDVEQFDAKVKVLRENYLDETVPTSNGKTGLITEDTYVPAQKGKAASVLNEDTQAAFNRVAGISGRRK